MFSSKCWWSSVSWKPYMKILIACMPMSRWVYIPHDLRCFLQCRTSSSWREAVVTWGDSWKMHKLAFSLLLERAWYLSHHTFSVPQSLTYQQLESGEKQQHLFVFNNALVSLSNGFWLYSISGIFLYLIHEGVFLALIGVMCDKQFLYWLYLDIVN